MPESFDKLPEMINQVGWTHSAPTCGNLMQWEPWRRCTRNWSRRGRLWRPRRARPRRPRAAADPGVGWVQQSGQAGGYGQSMWMYIFLHVTHVLAPTITLESLLFLRCFLFYSCPCLINRNPRVGTLVSSALRVDSPFFRHTRTQCNDRSFQPVSAQFLIFSAASTDACRKLSCGLGVGPID